MKFWKGVLKHRKPTKSHNSPHITPRKIEERLEKSSGGFACALRESGAGARSLADDLSPIYTTIFTLSDDLCPIYTIIFMMSDDLCPSYR